ncbi:MAG: alternative ribosome rescue aminoacyl-tRNA hydrolase ArfB [Pseudomonadota bacterium]
MAWIEITPRLAIAEEELSFSFVRASGPGGQNVNKVSSAVQLRFDAWGSPSLPDGVKSRLGRVAGSRMTQDGVIVIHAQSFRSQDRNREDAIARLVEMIREAAYVAPPRRKTRPTLASKERRLAAKERRGNVKSLRRGKPDVD